MKTLAFILLIMLWFLFACNHKSSSPFQGSTQNPAPPGRGTSVPLAPQNLTATSGYKKVTLNWETPSTGKDISHYEYRYSTTISSFDEKSNSPWIMVSSGGKDHQVVVSGLIETTHYYFQVRARNAKGGGPPANADALSYDSSAKPGVPIELRVTSGNRLVRLGWKAPSTVGASAITHYQYQHSLSPFDGDEYPWTDIPGDGREAIVTGLEGGVTHYFRLRAVNTAAHGISTPEVSGTPSAPEADHISCNRATSTTLPGTGTMSDPFVLCLRAHLELIGKTVINPAYTMSAHYVMGRDIDLNHIAWTPIPGTFTGSLKGRGKKIQNLTIHVNGNAALFLGLGSEGNIEGLGIEEFDITGSSQVGSLVAIQFSGSISHCYSVDSDASIDLSGEASVDKVGGLVGYQPSGTITSSYATGQSYGGAGMDYVGGLVGYQGGRIISSYATGKTDGGESKDYVGGLVGWQGSGYLTSSYATGYLYGGGGGDYVGGLVGYQTSGSIISSYATGHSHGSEGIDSVGGLVGFVSQGGRITSSYATGNSHGGEGSDDVGGLVGYYSNGYLTSSYATGDANGGKGSDDVGQLLGEQTTSSIISSYGWGDSTNGTSNTYGTPPTGVTSASDLTQAHSGTSDTHRWSSDAWDFVDNTQAPALKYVDGATLGDHDGDSNTPDTWKYTCTAMEAFLPSLTLTCGTSLLPEQPLRLDN